MLAWGFCLTFISISYGLNCIIMLKLVSPEGVVNVPYT